MSDQPRILSERLGLIEAVDHLLDKGAVVIGEAVVSLAEVDLVYLRLSLLLSSVETLRNKQPDAFAHKEKPVWLPAGSAAPQGAPLAYPAPNAQQIPFAPPAAGPPSTAGGDGPQTAETQARPSSQPDGHPSRARKQDGPSLLPRPSSSTGERPERGLAQLVLTLLELLRQVIEHQALRRVEGGSLSDDTIERLGLNLAQLEEKMRELRDIFDLKQEDLNIDLGPLGKLL